MWAVLSDTFDRFLGEHFNWCQGRGLDVLDWLDKYGSALSEFVGDENRKELRSAAEKETNADIEVMQQSQSQCNSVAIIFVKQFANLDCSVFQRQVSLKIRDLENLDYDEVEVARFKKTMMVSTKTLREAKSVSFKRQTMKFVLFTHEMSQVMVDPNDLWQKPFISRLKTIAVHTKQVPWMQWEEVLYGNSGMSSMVNVAQTIKLPESLLRDMIICRKAAKKLIGSAETFAKMRHVLSGGREKALLELEPTFEMDIAYLNEFVDPRATEIIKTKTMRCLPTPKSPVQFAEVVVLDIVLVLVEMSSNRLKLS